MYVGSDSLQTLVLARRLLVLNRQIETQRQDPNAETKSFKEIMEEDEVHLSGGMEANSTTPSNPKVRSTQENGEIKYSDLSKRAGEFQQSKPPEGTSFETLA